MSGKCQLLTHAPQQKGSVPASAVYSGNPAFRRPSVTKAARLIARPKRSIQRLERRD